MSVPGGHWWMFAFQHHSMFCRRDLFDTHTALGSDGRVGCCRVVVGRWKPVRWWCSSTNFSGGTTTTNRALSNFTRTDTLNSTALTGCWTRENLVFSPLLASCWTLLPHRSTCCCWHGEKFAYDVSRLLCFWEILRGFPSDDDYLFFFLTLVFASMSIDSWHTGKWVYQRTQLLPLQLLPCHVLMVFPYTTIIINYRFDVHANVLLARPQKTKKKENHFQSPYTL